MGLFDDIVVKVPLPDFPEGFEARFQTKSLICFLEKYEIREDGTLWREEYDIEDRSDKNAASGTLESVRGMLTRVNQRWVPESEYTGEVEFHDWMPDAKEMLQYSAYFVAGALKELHRIPDRPRG